MAGRMEFPQTQEDGSNNHNNRVVILRCTPILKGCLKVALHDTRRTKHLLFIWLPKITDSGSTGFMRKFEFWTRLDLSNPPLRPRRLKSDDCDGYRSAIEAYCNEGCCGQEIRDRLYTEHDFRPGYEWFPDYLLSTLT